MSNFQSTKLISLGSCAFRQPSAKSHCRWIHGYRLKAKFLFGCDKLDNNNWVVDFGGLKGLRKKLEKQFDHTMCVAASDPVLPYFQDLANEDVCDLRIMDGVGIEKFAEWCFDVADHLVGSMTKNRCWVDRVEVFEHENNSAAYNRPHDLEGVSTYHATGSISSPDIPEEPPEKIVMLEPPEGLLDLRLDTGEPLASNTTQKTDLPPVEAIEDSTPVSDKKEEKKKRGVENVSIKPKRVTNKWIDPNVTSPWGF